MGYLTIHSELAPPHCGVLFESGGGNYWFGLRGDGHNVSAKATIDCCDRTWHVFRYVRFSVPSSILAGIRGNWIGSFYPDKPNAFANSNYLREHPQYDLFNWGGHNCVYFAKSIVQRCNLRYDPAAVTPDWFVRSLIEHNKPVSSGIYGPFPWSPGAVACPYCPTTGQACG